MSLINNKQNKIRDDNIDNVNEDNELGYSTDLTKDTPFIKFLIEKRLNFCQLGPSSHIAVFIPVTIKSLYYFKENGKAVIGENSNTPLFPNSKVKTHAEIDALTKLKDLLRCKKIKKNKMNLIVLRINKSGNLCESAPCFHCTKLLSENNLIIIDKLYFSRSDRTITCIKFNKWVDNGTAHVSKSWRWLHKKTLKKNL